MIQIKGRGNSDNEPGNIAICCYFCSRFLRSSVFGIKNLISIRMPSFGWIAGCLALDVISPFNLLHRIDDFGHE